MNDDAQSILWALLRRGVPAAVAMAIGVGVLLGAGDAGTMLLGFLFFLIAAIFIAGPIARLLAEPMGSLFWPRQYNEKPQPMYGIPQSRRVRGLPEEAIAEYEKIAEAFPEEITPHLEMIEIALADLRDPSRANDFYQRGLARLTKPEDKDRLATVYAATRERQAPKPAHRIEMPPPPPIPSEENP